ncbi:WecB/TagA/CpsF family glycosyltransferase [Pedobacter polaris]|uniref:WecB/TagA/CpsF family glycosyltransferase n=1 Tax=Pedobacter polaris TaxID=2571273 RepID=A0A4U1CVV2_9SPHI|nr:WecB/TagA/CpsF family glycosyltransferase [Pedobacter polaris]TKC13074.1 WecB/TagA/CpsF family glycosyltransferase [Pedobacter polaris]
MQEYFNVSLEFDHEVFKHTIEKNIENNGKGYVCVVDANVLTIAQKNTKFRKVLNNSMVNTCDGSSIAMLAGIIYKQNYRALNGPTLFAHYIEKKYSQLLLGSNEETSNKIKEILEKKGIDNRHLSVMPLPFKAVEEFDYVEISKYINGIKPQIIWVSLGAPKQEVFMSNLLPYLDKGIMFGIGAAFNFYIGNIALPDAKIGALKFIWVSRIFSEPMKQLPRILPYIKVIPKLFFQEKRKLRNQLKK